MRRLCLVLQIPDGESDAITFANTLIDVGRDQDPNLQYPNVTLLDARFAAKGEICARHFELHDVLEDSRGAIQRVLDSWKGSDLIAAVRGLSGMTARIDKVITDGQKEEVRSDDAAEVGGWTPSDGEDQEC